MRRSPSRPDLTLYWYLRRIAGPGLTAIYNMANAVLYCILAGAMIAVSATAIGLPLGIKTPALTDVYPTSLGWVLLTFAIGVAFLTLAILGFEKLSKFGQVVLSLDPRGLHRRGPSRHSRAWGFTPIWTTSGRSPKAGSGTALPSAGRISSASAHVIFFAWFCNLAMHIGLSDMALFRYARHWAYGLYSAFGMYPGHMLAWICSGIMVARQ